LTEQRLKEVVIAPVDQGYANRRVAQGAARGQSTETTSHEHHTRQ
jgi:hypothetical protein